MSAVVVHAQIQAAAAIPSVTAAEAETLLQTEFGRFLALLETLTPADWARPTACTLWTVRDMVAHQAGGYASGTSYGEMLRQYAALPRRGQLPEDAINDRQVRERASRSPAELIAELRAVGPAAIRNWAHGFRLIKPITVAHLVGGQLSVRHLMWVIHSRDTWMHRLDICRAAGRAFHQTPEHDGRIVALVLRDVDRVLSARLGGRAVAFELTGAAGGVWQVGPGQAAAILTMDALAFNCLASGRDPYTAGQTAVTIRGDAALAEFALRSTLVLY